MGQAQICGGIKPDWIGLCVLNTIFTNILLTWLKLILFVGKSGLPSENNWPALSQWQSLSNEVVFWTTSPTIIWSLQGKPSNLVLKIYCSLEWLLFITERAIFQLVVYHDKNKIHFNEMMMMSALYWSNTPSWISIVLVHWDNSLWVYKLLHSDKLSWFLANQSLLLPGILCALRWSSTCQFYCQKFYWRRKPKEFYVYKEFTYGQSKYILSTQSKYILPTQSKMWYNFHEWIWLQFPQINPNCYFVHMIIVSKFQRDWVY